MCMMDFSIFNVYKYNGWVVNVRKTDKFDNVNEETCVCVNEIYFVKYSM